MRLNKVWVACSDAAIITATRIGGILSGVALSLLLSVTIMPKSASHQATDNLSAAMTGLINLSKCVPRCFV
jgi:hypothetical protein